MGSPAEEEALELIRHLGVVRPRDLDRHGISRSRLYRLVKKGLVLRQARGVYTAGDHAPTADHALAQVAKRVPSAIVCLLSALRFHQLTTQLPHQVWIALPKSARRPSIDFPPLRVVRFTGRARTAGVEVHGIEGVEVRITSPAKTVVDCFKYRNKIGLDVALEALREAWRERRITIDEIDRFARICRVERVMRPYLEALVG
jgi:predicted transcriptional regulator of viral defense system